MEPAGRNLWRLATRFDPRAVRISMATRNTIGVLLPLSIGLATGWPHAGLAAASGALATSFSDGVDSYAERAGRMLAAGVVISLAMGAGALSGTNGVIAVVVATIAAFGAGLAYSLSQPAAEICAVSLVWLLVYSGQALPLEHALVVAPLAMAGALLQTGLSLLLWPFEPYGPERRALGALFLELARMSRTPTPSADSLPGGDAIRRSSLALRNLQGDGTPAAASYRAMLSEAERIRVSLISLGESRSRLLTEASPDQSDAFDDFINECGAALDALGKMLLNDRHPSDYSPALRELDVAAGDLRRRSSSSPTPPTQAFKDALFQVDALTRQMHDVKDLADGSADEPRAAVTPDATNRVSRRAWRRRLSNVLATFRANLNRRSVVFQHAVRLAVCIAASDGFAHALAWTHAFWIPMTTAIVLRPDFATTMTRGAFRIVGEMVGLLLATALFHLLPSNGLANLALVAAFMFLLRAVGPAHFAVFSLSISALMVLLLAFLGATPGRLVAERAISVLMGGALALVVYRMWPSSEGCRLENELSRLLRANRDYFRVVAGRVSADATSTDTARARARVLGSNLEATVQRWMIEPQTSAADVDLIRAIMASSVRLAQAVVSLDAGAPARASASPQFAKFAGDVDTSLSYLARAVRRSSFAADALPDLRDDVRLMTTSAGAPKGQNMLHVEVDRIANSIDTLARQISLWCARSSSEQLNSRSPMPVGVA